MKHFAENLKLLRKAWGLSQTDMSNKFEVSQSTYGRWEDGAEPNLDTLLALAAFFKVPFGDFITKELKPEDVPPRWGGNEPATSTPEQVEEPQGEYENQVSALKKEIDELKNFILKLSEQLLTDRQDRVNLEREVEKMKWKLLALERQEETLADAVEQLNQKKK